MNIQELIQKLSHIKEEHGNVDIFVSTSSYNFTVIEANEVFEWKPLKNDKVYGVVIRRVDSEI